MNKLWALLCVAFFADPNIGSPVKRNSPVEIELASPFEEIGGNFEGDMVLSLEQQDAVKHGYTSIIDDSITYKWPNGVVPYVLDNSVYSLTQRNSIESALQEIELVSCLQFVRRTTQKDYIFVTGSATSGCSSAVGRRGNMQTLSLQPNGCLSRGTIIHEFLHALGFVHMHSASDRDFFVTINESAISQQNLRDFSRRNSTQVEDYGIPYDYDSVMHYGPKTYSANGEMTIIPKVPGVTIGQRVGLSYKDIKRLNYRYPNCYK
ncbi:zinc metalloproteinase nas-14-like [Anopheles ziemanni]|uniref:zinc metalloproteinase nas-14-like n=1 Tax=Anopheles coustani TaxID=139045 RepID=UPI00265A4C11|nr:zinc metalloproteinase nas-14-like [Anopheles coustani]XP_058170175.1 zinc metalloproteinase nas-14-like [Anopheles ziemanni]